MDNPQQGSRLDEQAREIEQERAALELEQAHATRIRARLAEGEEPANEHERELIGPAAERERASRLAALESRRVELERARSQ